MSWIIERAGSSLSWALFPGNGGTPNAERNVLNGERLGSSLSCAMFPRSGGTPNAERDALNDMDNRTFRVIALLRHVSRKWWYAKCRKGCLERHE